jgi:uncharacterized protein YbcV (DUF1398 family)
MDKLNARVMFDNAGGISVDLGGFKFFYLSPKQAAADYNEFIKNGNTDDWEGSDESIIIYDGTDKNGGHKTVNREEIDELVNGRDDYYWGFNEQYFIEELRRLKK